MPSLSQIARDVVRRSRAGDQIATAAIIKVREEMLKGDKRQIKNHAAIVKYIESHPLRDYSVRRQVKPIAIAGTRIGIEAANTLGQLKTVTDRAGIVSEFDDGFRLGMACDCLLLLPYLGGPQAMDVSSILLARGLPLANTRLATMVERIPNDKCREIFSRAIIGEELELPDEYMPYMIAGSIVGTARGLQLGSFSDLGDWELE